MADLSRSHSIYVPDSLWEAIEAHAKEVRASSSEVIVFAMRSYLKASEQYPEQYPSQSQGITRQTGTQGKVTLERGSESPEGAAGMSDEARSALRTDQPRRQLQSEAQFATDLRLRRVLTAWGHGPEFIESLLSWGYEIRSTASAEPLRVALQNLVWAWDQREGVEIAHEEARAVLAAAEEHGDE